MHRTCLIFGFANVTRFSDKFAKFRLKNLFCARYYFHNENNGESRAAADYWQKTEQFVFLKISGVQRPTTGGFGSEVRSAEIPEHARESGTRGRVTLVRDSGENVVPESADEAQEAIEEAQHEQRWQLQFGATIDRRDIARR